MIMFCINTYYFIWNSTGNLRKQNNLAEIGWGWFEIILGFASGYFNMTRMISNQPKPISGQTFRGYAENCLPKYSTRLRGSLKYPEAKPRDISKAEEPSWIFYQIVSASKSWQVLFCICCLRKIVISNIYFKYNIGFLNGIYPHSIMIIPCRNI